MSKTPETQTKSAHPVLKITAPFVAYAATWAVDRALTAGYTALTGRETPDVNDRAVSFPRALIWTIATTATGAVIQLIIYRAVSEPAPEDQD